MRYGLVFLALGAVLVALAGEGGLALAALWPAVSFGLVGVAYLGGRPSILGKRADGTFAPAAALAVGPYLLLTWAIYRASILLGRERCADEVAPGLWVGRRPRAGELPDGVLLVVDLTAELAADRGVRARGGWLCVPTLDGAAPPAKAFRELLERLRGERGVYVHCAFGHGRSATVAAALLLARGLATDPGEAERELRRHRPGIRLNAAQRASLLLVLAPPTA